MDVEVLPGPSLAERARTAVTKARLATLIWVDPDPARDRRVTATAAIRVGRAGAPLLLLAPRASVIGALAASPLVTVTIPAPAPLGSLALTGTVWPRAEADGRLGYRLDLRALQFAGGGGGPVALAAYHGAGPSSTWSAGTWPSSSAASGPMACTRPSGWCRAAWTGSAWNWR